MTDIELLHAAKNAAANSYCPYSGFSVGAALLAASGRVYTGVNVENASFGATNCAERTALYSAIAAGEREFISIAIASLSKPMTYPCGICLQALSEFLPNNASVILESENGGAASMEFSSLLPSAFRLREV